MFESPPVNKFKNILTRRLHVVRTSCKKAWNVISPHKTKTNSEIVLNLTLRSAFAAPQYPTTMKIAILDDYQDAVRKLDCFQLLAEHEVKVFNNGVRGIGQLATRLAEVEGLVLIRERTRINAQLLDKLPRLKIISQTGKASGHIDVDACSARGITVLEGVGSPVAPAELTWALIMAAQRRIPQYVANLKQGAWQQSGLRAAAMPPNFGMGQVLRGQTLGIWGYGKIGRLIAGYGRAFGMKVVVWGREMSLDHALKDGYEVAGSKAALFEHSDVLSIHLRMHDDTRGAVSLSDLLSMKPTALFVNTSRAELVEENAMVAALGQGRPGMVAVDVFESEPILQGHGLLRMENAICTPHLGFVERESYELYFRSAFQNILNFLAGDSQSAVNPGAVNKQ